MKKVRFRKIAALITVVLYILTLMPTTIAFAADSDASAYDVHIKGNFVAGETLTANYTYYNPSGNSEVKSNAIYTWYYKKDNSGRFNVTKIAEKTGDNTLVIPADICETGKWGALKDIFVSVSTADSNGNGEPVFSGFYIYPIPGNDVTATVHSSFWAVQAHLVPKNPEGTVEVGDTLVARYSYQKRDKTPEGSTTFTWYRKDTHNGAATVIQEESTNGEYTLTKEDYGKWIECTVTAYDANGKKGGASTAKIHYGHMGTLADTSVSVTSLSEIIDADSGAKYPVKQLIGDGNAIMNKAVSHGSYISAYSWGGNGVIEYDFGKALDLEGFYMDITNPGNISTYITYALTEYTVEYSEDGTVWNVLKTDKADVDVDAKTHSWSSGYVQEFRLDKAVKARYVRYKGDHCHLLRMEDFYPISSMGTLPTLTLNGDKEMGILVGQDYEEPGFKVLDAAGNELSEDEYEVEIEGLVDTSVTDSYEIIYKVTYRGVELTDTRIVTVGTGIKTPGDMAFGKEVTSENAENSEFLNDGNSTTLWQATAAEAQAVIDLGEIQPISRFVINEEGENVTGFNLYVSSVNGDWGEPVYSGEALSGEIEIKPAEGQFVKLEITSSSANAQIKDFEVHVTDDAKVALACKKFEPEFETDDVISDFMLPGIGAYGTAISWESSDSRFIEIDGSNAIVMRDEDKHIITLTATFSLNDAQTASKEIEVKLARTAPEGAAESSASAYDVRISGNFMKGLKVVADYDYAPGEDGYEETDKADAYFEWYRFNDIRSGESGVTKVWEGYRENGGHIYTIDAGAANDNDWGIDTNIFVSVRTRNDNGYGAPVFSGFYGPPRDGLNETSTGATPYAWSAHIVPKNEEGSMELGDTVAARHTYYAINGAKDASTYQWFVKDTVNGAETDLEGETGATYTIGKEAFGKYIGCRITPVTAEYNKAGKTITTLSHYGNLGQTKGAYVTATGVTTFTNYPLNKLLSEGGSRHGAASYANLYSPKYANRVAVYDMGREVEFDGVFFSIWGTTKSVNHKISYSSDNQVWTLLYEGSEGEELGGENEFRTNAPAKARYFKLEGGAAAGSDMYTAEFYPISAIGSLPTLTLKGKEEMTVLKGETFVDPGYKALDANGNELIADISGDVVNTDALGTYEVIYTLSYRGVEITKTRKVTVANGVQSEGDMAFGNEVTSQGATGSQNLTDGNPYTVWETTSLPATAVIDLGSKQPISEFIISEDGNRVSSYNIYVSDSKTNWGESVYTGTSFDGTISIEPQEARYIKLEITAASGSVRIKSFEAHLDSASRLALAVSKFSPAFATENITESFDLPAEGEYGSEISWSVKSGNAIEIAAGSRANVTRGIKTETVVLIASFTIGDLAPQTREVTITVKGNPEISEGVSTASAYDVHIEGNFIKGGILTAEYKYYDPAGNEENPEAALIKWYQSKMGDSTPAEIGTGKTLTITEAIRAAGKNNVFVTVQTASTSNDEGVVGVPVYSNYYGGIAAANSTQSETGAPKAFGAHLVPQNPEGTTKTGDIIKAYFTYQEPNLIEEGAHIYEWRTYASLKDYEVPVTVQKGTNAAYEIKAEDFGKYIECIITPVSADGTQGKAIKTRNSLGNLAFGKDTKVNFLYKPFDYSVYGHNAYETHGHFAAQRLLTDGSGNEGATSYLKSKWANAQGSYTPAVVFDLGEVKEFNGFYMNIKNFTAAVNDMTFSYSLTGEDGSWINLAPLSMPLGETEVLLEKPAKARFVKYNYTSGGTALEISDFYPVLTEEALPTITLNGKDIMYVLLNGVWEDPGYVANAATGEELEAVVSGDGVNTSEAGTYEITYTVTHGEYPSVSVTRTVIVDSGIPSDGDMAFRKSVTSTNANNSDALTDGNPYTIWETTALPASAVIDLGEECNVSKFVIDEDGESISSYNIYVSSDGESWGEAIYSGNESVAVTELTKARFVKLEITEASAPVRIKAFEVHLTPESMLYLAKEALEVPGADNLYAYVALPSKGLFDTTVTWVTSDASLVSTDGVVTRSEERKEAVLTATITLEGLSPVTKEIPVSIAPFSAPFATDVHIKGNFVVGETVTAEFSYYDPENIPEGDAEYQWWRGNNFASGEAGKISGATEKSYTITEEDLSYTLYVSVIAKNKTGEGSVTAFSAIYDDPQSKSVEEEPVVSNPYISSMSPEETMLVGDTIRVHYTYTERGGVPEGKTTYLWITKETPDSVPKTVQAESANDTYTITEDDFGKWIECIITPYSETGLRGKSVTAKNHYGNGFLTNDTKSYTGTSWMYSQKGINAGRIYSFDEAGANSCNRTTSLSEIVYSMDAGREIEFDAIHIKGGSADKLKLEYSNDGENYTELPLDEKQKTLTGNIGKDFEFENVIRARYIRLTVTNISKGYYDMTAFYPYITYKAGPEITVYKAEGEDICQYQPFTDNSFTAVDAYGQNVNHLVVTEGTVNTDVVGKYSLKYILSMPGYPTVTATKIYNVVESISSKGDVAFGKDVTASSDAEALTDGNVNTSWTSAEANEDITINFGKKTGISKIYLGETTSNITAVSVYVSENGSTWKEAALNAPLTEGSVSFDAYEAAYVKISVSATAPFTLHSVEAYLDDAGKVKLAHKNLTVPSSTDEDLALAKNGEYGVSVSWESSNSSVISKDGAITRGTSDVTVTLTATVKNDALTLTKEFEVTVKARKQTPAGSGGGGGGGGSSGGGSGFGSFGGNSAPDEKVELPTKPTTPVTPQETYKVFKDVADSHWAAEYINALSNENIISGKGEGIFEPEANITRAEFLKLLIESLNLKAASESKETFSDVSADSWYAEYVNIAVSLGIANGTGDGKFSPDAPILRRDMAVLSERAVKAAGKELKNLSDATLSDYDTIKDYAKASVTALANAGIISGNEKGEFMPDSLASRAQSAKIIYMLKEQVKE